MKPDFESNDGRVKLYCGDCLEIGSSLQAVDAVITDPPYGIDFDYGDAHNDDPEKYCEFMRRAVIVSETMVHGGPIFMWQAMLNAPKWHEWFPSEYRMFAACKGFVQFCPTPIQFSWDPVVFWGKCRGEPSVYRKDWHIQSLAPFGLNRERVEHPCPRPVEQVEVVIDAATKAGDTVADLFMGSGTTGIACLRTCRQFIGIEISEQYFQVAKERIQRELAQLTLPI